ncbi:unnamed protein product [Rotaria socialis]|uniref:IF rod domain-containing protein n=5 Tax=Rotaria socialis TaxID=392032 RepID=A0A817TGA6_9BILA|nr:unnamed protein product [Rotaria socialis]CAF3314881.1 unnamed protein product [Rotaria socialis]CAF3332316.1 unnamed protein product [Rotaria socialis]CAF3336305.1 unnamed protein product [Rotaria socialis]CAF4341908.1 unnamed protein product [Rotaria socialis]
MNPSNMYNNYEQLQSTSSRSSGIHTEESFVGSGVGTTAYRSAMGPRVTSSQRSRATGFGSGISRIQQSSLSSVSGSNFGQGLASLVNVAGVAIRGSRSATYASITDAASLQIQSTRLREKRDLVFLNDKFAQYVEKVRYLEAHNRKLAMELNYLQNRSGQGSTHLKVMYETEIQEATKLVEDSKRMAGDAHSKIVEAEEELKRQKARFTCLSTSRADQKEFHDLLERYVENQGHIALFRRRVADLEDEIRLYKVEGQRLTSELSSVQNQIRSELSLRSTCDMDRASLNEQFIILKETHEAQLAELRSKLVSVDLDPSKFFRNELAMAIREIRKEYDSLVESQRSELQARYSILINDISVQSQRSDSTYALTGEHYREVERMRAELLAAQNQTSYFRSKVQQLQNLVSDLQLKIKAFKESSAFAASRIEREINDAAAYLSHIEDNYKKVMALKTTLEQEIATYRLYLESADGLRGCVDRIVQSAEQKIYEQPSGSNYAYASQGQDLVSGASTTDPGSSASNYVSAGTRTSTGFSNLGKQSATVPSRSEVYSSNGLVGQSNSQASRASESEHSNSQASRASASEYSVPASHKTRENILQGYAAARQYTKPAGILRNSASSSQENLSQYMGPREAAKHRSLLGEGASTSCGSVSLENSLNEQ